MAPKLLTEIEPARPASGGKLAVGPTYRASYAPKGPKDLGVSSSRELFETSVEKFATRPCLGSRTLRDPSGPAGAYEFLTYREVADTVTAVHGAYAALGVQPKDRVGIIGANSPEWMMALQGISRLNGVCVPLYDTLGEAAVEYVLSHASVRLVVAQANKLPLIASLLSKGTKEVVSCGVVYWGKAAPEPLKVLADAGVKVLSWTEAVQLGKGNPTPSQPVGLDDISTIMYTSGTTGNPKGVVLSQRAVLATISGLQGLLDQIGEEMGTEDVYFSFLTMAHIFGRVAEEFMLHIGASIGYWQGDVKKLMEDVGALKPTLFAGVPRVFERIYHGVLDSVKKGGLIKGLVFKYAYWRKKWYIEQGWRHEQASVISDLLVFNKIKARLGGRVRLIVTGGAPIPAHVEEFLKVTMCAPIVQGYGLTETCAASFIQFPYDINQTFTVGPPMPQTELRLEAVPELGYSPTDDPPRGEVCLRGPGNFNGYYRDEAQTKEVLDADGFFHTGDIGEITPSGALRLIDRKKNLFKLAHGEYIAVEVVENKYKESELVEQIWVYGNSFESCVVAVLVPREGPLRQLAEQEGIAGASDAPLKDLLSNSTVNAAVLKKLQATGRAGKLKGFEEIKAIYLEEEPFSVENDLMTPSFKVKRAPLLKRYKPQIDAMYAKLKQGSAGAS